MSDAPHRTKKPLLVAFVTIFLDLLGFGIIIPIQPFFAESLGASATLVTLLGASYSLMQFLFAPFWGRLSDRIGRRPVILVSVAISAVGHFIFAQSTTLTMLFFARSLAGFGNANLATAQAVIADSTTPENRAKGMGLIGAAFGLGFIFGPAIGALLGQIGPTTPLYAASALALVNLALAWRFLPETLVRDETGAPPRAETLLEQLKQLGNYANAYLILMITLISTIAFAQMEQVIALFIEHVWVTDQQLSTNERISQAVKLTGIFLVCIGVTAALVQGALIGKLTKRFGEVRLSQIGLLMMTLSLAIIPYIGATESFLLLLLLAPFMATGTGLLNPSKNSLISRSVPGRKQGVVLGLNQSSAALGRVLGPAFAGFIYEMHTSYPFYGGAALLAVSWLLCFRLKPPEEHP